MKAELLWIIVNEGGICSLNGSMPAKMFSARVMVIGDGPWSFYFCYQVSAIPNYQSIVFQQ